MKRKENPTGGWHAKNTQLRQQVVLSRIFKRMVQADYSYQSEKKCQESFLYLSSNSFARRLTLWTALSTSPPGHPGLPAITCICVVGFLPVELNVYFSPPTIKLMVTTPNYPEKMEKNYEDINTTVSFSVLHCFRSMGYFLHINST